MAEAYEQIKDPNKRAWFKLALEHGQRNKSFIEIKPGSEQWAMWLQYFGRLGWMPHTLDLAIKNNEFERRAHDENIRRGKTEKPPQFKTWTAPCEWPSSLGRA